MNILVVTNRYSYVVLEALGIERIPSRRRLATRLYITEKDRYYVLDYDIANHAWDYHRRGYTYARYRLPGREFDQLIIERDAMPRLNLETLDFLRKLVKFEFNPKKELPARSMALKGLGQFHSVPVNVYLRGSNELDPQKAWYMFATKKWVYENTNQVIDVEKWISRTQRETIM